jgi:hypothetical protein
MGDTGQGFHHARMRMGMLMGIHVRGLDPSATDALNLRAQFSLDIAALNHSTTQLPDQGQKRSGKPAVLIRQRWHITGWRDSGPADQYQVAPHAQSRVGASQLYGVVKSIGVRHEGRARQDSLAKCADDARVHAPREAEIISVDNQLLHAGTETTRDVSK